MELVDRRLWLREALEKDRPSEIPRLNQCGMAAQDYEAWSEDFHRWVLQQCVFNPRCWQSIGSLQVAFGEWTILNKSVPCQRDVFEQLLSQEGFRVSDGLVFGLGLIADLKLLARWR